MTKSMSGLPFLSTVSRRIVTRKNCCTVFWRNFCSVLGRKCCNMNWYNKNRWKSQEILGSMKEIYLNKMKKYALSDRPVQENEMMTFVFIVDTDTLPYLMRLLKVCIYNDHTSIKKLNWNIMHMFTCLNASKEAHSYMELILVDHTLITRMKKTYEVVAMYLDLLFKNQMYSELVQSCDSIYSISTLRSFDLSCIYIYSCYLLSTTESLEKALKHLKEYQKIFSFDQHSSKLKHMVAHLALQQNRNTECLELLADTVTDDGIQMQAAALARLGEFHAAKILLDSKREDKVIYREILKDLLQSVQEHGNKDLDAKEIIVFGAQKVIQTDHLFLFSLKEHFHYAIRNHSELS